MASQSSTSDCETLVITPHSTTSSDSEFEGFITPGEYALSNLPLETEEEEIESLFSPFGEVREALILNQIYLNRHEEKTRQGLVKFANSPLVKDVLKLNGKSINGVPIYVAPRGNDRTVFFISGYQETTAESIQNVLSSRLERYGDILKFFLPKNGEDEYLGFCYVLISGENSESAANLNGTVLEDGSNCLTVRKAVMKTRVLRAEMAV